MEKRVYRNLKELTSLVLMINELMDIYSEEIKSENLYKIMQEVKIIINDKYNELKKEILNSKYFLDIELNKSQEFKLIIERMNIKQKNDFEFCMEIMYFLKTEEFKLFEILYNSKDYFDENIKEIIKKIIRELSYIILKFKDYALNLFSNN